jgi:hypothetical protein
MRDATMVCADWMAASRQVLTMMTGRSFPDDTIDSTARTLRFPAIGKEIWQDKKQCASSCKGFTVGTSM